MPRGLFTSQNLYEHTVNWSKQQFGAEYADETARIINSYPLLI